MEFKHLEFSAPTDNPHQLLTPTFFELMKNPIKQMIEKESHLHARQIVQRILQQVVKARSNSSKKVQPSEKKFEFLVKVDEPEPLCPSDVPFKNINSLISRIKIGNIPERVVPLQPAGEVKISGIEIDSTCLRDINVSIHRDEHGKFLLKSQLLDLGVHAVAKIHGEAIHIGTDIDINASLKGTSVDFELKIERDKETGFPKKMALVEETCRPKLDISLSFSGEPSETPNDGVVTAPDISVTRPNPSTFTGGFREWQQQERAFAAFQLEHTQQGPVPEEGEDANQNRTSTLQNRYCKRVCRIWKEKFAPFAACFFCTSMIFLLLMPSLFFNGSGEHPKMESMDETILETARLSRTNRWRKYRLWLVQSFSDCFLSTEFTDTTCGRSESLLDANDNSTTALTKPVLCTFEFIFPPASGSYVKNAVTLQKNGLGNFLLFEGVYPKNHLPPNDALFYVGSPGDEFTLTIQTNVTVELIFNPLEAGLLHRLPTGNFEKGGENSFVSGLKTTDVKEDEQNADSKSEIMLNFESDCDAIFFAFLLWWAALGTSAFLGSFWLGTACSPTVGGWCEKRRVRARLKQIEKRCPITNLPETTINTVPQSQSQPNTSKSDTIKSLENQKSAEDVESKYTAIPSPSPTASGTDLVEEEVAASPKKKRMKGNSSRYRAAFLAKFSLASIHPDTRTKIRAKKGALSNCIICLEKFSAGESVRTLPCGHYFHLNCINEWLFGQEDVVRAVSEDSYRSARFFRIRCPICNCDVSKKSQTDWGMSCDTTVEEKLESGENTSHRNAGESRNETKQVENEREEKENNDR
eukprot:g688.t1